MRAHVHEAPAAGDVAALRSRGRRVTRQRELIWNALVRAGERHVSAREVAEAVPELHQATVYRTLDVLTEEGLVRRTGLEGRAVFELAAEHRHHHVVCTGCGRVAHVHDDALAAALARIEDESGYTLAETELALYGVCAGCRS